MRAEQTGAEEPDRYIGAGAGHGLHDLSGHGGLEVGLQLDHVLGKMVRGILGPATQGAGRGLVAARRPAEAEINAARVKGRQSAELLGDHQGRVVGQHDAAGPDADGGGARRHMADHQGRRGAGDARHVVMFGQPETLVAEPLGVLRQFARSMQSLGHRATVDDVAQIEDGKRNHAAVCSSRCDLPAIEWGPARLELNLTRSPLQRGRTNRSRERRAVGASSA